VEGEVVLLVGQPYAGFLDGVAVGDAVEGNHSKILLCWAALRPKDDIISRCTVPYPDTGFRKRC